MSDTQQGRPCLLFRALMFEIRVRVPALLGHLFGHLVGDLFGHPVWDVFGELVRALALVGAKARSSLPNVSRTRCPNNVPEQVPNKVSNQGFNNNVDFECECHAPPACGFSVAILAEGCCCFFG